jgi:hypothetical protein
VRVNDPRQSAGERENYTFNAGINAFIKFLHPSPSPSAAERTRRDGGPANRYNLALKRTKCL